MLQMQKEAKFAPTMSACVRACVRACMHACMHINMSSINVCAMFAVSFSECHADNIRHLQELWTQFSIK